MIETRRRLEEALAELDPYNLFFQWIASLQLLQRRVYAQAIARIKAILPDFPTAHWGLSIAFHAMGSHDDALSEAQAWLSLGARVPTAGEALTRGYAEGGYATAMRGAADVLAARSHQAPPMYVDPHLIAQLYACAGDNDPALAWLEREYEQRSNALVYLSVHPLWDGMRHDPRFRNLVRRMRLPS